MNENIYVSMFKDAPEVMSVLEAAKMLHLGKNKTYELIKEGRIRSIRIGNKTIVPKICLIEYLTDDNNYQNRA